jgi:hypothetical protein
MQKADRYKNKCHGCTGFYIPLILFLMALNSEAAELYEDI